MGKIPVFISNGLWLLLKNLLVFFQVPLSQHLGKLSWKISVYHSGCLGNNFATLCFSSALWLWKVAAPENEAQKGLIHGENIHLFHRRPRWQGAHSQTLRRCLAMSVEKPWGSLAHWVLCSRSQGGRAWRGVWNKSPTRGRLGQEGIPMHI